MEFYRFTDSEISDFKIISYKIYDFQFAFKLKSPTHEVFKSAQDISMKYEKCFK